MESIELFFYDLEYVKKNLKQDEVLFVQIKTVFNETYYVDFDYLSDIPEEKMISFTYSLSSKEIDYEDIRNISYFVECCR